jgi:uncharacterized membrane protein YidH (DUF202 family)
MEKAMTDSEKEISTGSPLMAFAKLSIAGITALFCLGMIVGILHAHSDNGGGMPSVTMLLLLAILAFGTAGLGFYFYRQTGNLLKPASDATRKERLYRKIMIMCVILGVAISMVLSFNSDTAMSDFSLSSPFSSETPISTALALVLAAIWGLIMPLFAWYWHRNAIDEQEAAAYRDGAYYAAYAYIIIAPLWWILWRGALLPKPDGVAIFVVFNFIWLITWGWKKYH